MKDGGKDKQGMTENTFRIDLEWRCYVRFKVFKLYFRFQISLFSSEMAVCAVLNYLYLLSMNILLIFVFTAPTKEKVFYGCLIFILIPQFFLHIKHLSPWPSSEWTRLMIMCVWWKVFVVWIKVHQEFQWININSDQSLLQIWNVQSPLTSFSSKAST